MRELRKNELGYVSGGNGPPAHSNAGGNKQGNNGYGNGGGDGVPGKSGKTDVGR